METVLLHWVLCTQCYQSIELFEDPLNDYITETRQILTLERLEALHARYATTKADRFH